MDSYFQNKMFSSYYGTKSFIQQEESRNPGSQPKRHHALKIVSPECRQNCTDKIGYIYQAKKSRLAIAPGVWALSVMSKLGQNQALQPVSSHGLMRHFMKAVHLTRSLSCFSLNKVFSHLCKQRKMPLKKENLSLHLSFPLAILVLFLHSTSTIMQHEHQP